MNIGIDIDDTISETFETLLPYAQKYTIEDLDRESKVKIDSNLTNHFYIIYMNGWSEEEAKKFWLKYYTDILKHVNIKKFAAEVINGLKNDGHKIFLITARWDMPNDDINEITKNWLKQNNIKYDRLITNASDKLKIVKDNNIDLFIDDSFSNCKNVVDNSSTKVYMMTSRVNGSFEYEKIKRVFSWPEIYHSINKGEN